MTGVPHSVNVSQYAATALGKTDELHILCQVDLLTCQDALDQPTGRDDCLKAGSRCTDCAPIVSVSAAAGSSRPPMRSATAAGCAPRGAPAGASAPSSFRSAAERCRTEDCGDSAAFRTGLGSVCMQGEHY